MSPLRLLDISKLWYSAQELAGLPGLPGSERNVREMAQREGWQSRKKTVGKGLEYHRSSLPPETQQALAMEGLRRARKAENQAMIAAPAKALAIPAARDLKDWQRKKMDARLTILRWLETLAQSEGSMNKAILEAVEIAKADLLPEPVEMALPVALGKAGERGELSVRTLKRWCAAKGRGITALAPQPKERLGEPEWAARFLRVYRKPHKPTIVACIKQLAEQGRGEIPTYHQARRYLSTRVGAIEAIRGRVLAKDLRGVMPFIRRDTSMLVPGSVMNGDGHTWNSLVAHPETGKPFVPEVTNILDIRTRRWLGFSVGFSESSEVVVDAICMAVETGGIMAVLQWDRGRGAKNIMMEDPVTGMAQRLGFEVYHPQPYNSQAGGVIERSHQTILIEAAKKMPTFIGKRIKDPELRRYMLKKIKAGKVRLPVWAELIQLLQEAMVAYNTGHYHRSLPRITDPITGKKRHMTPNEMWQREVAEGWKPVLLDDAELIHEFRPERQCTVRRGEITFWKMTYFSKELTEFNENKVRVRYDIRDGSRVWIYAMDGRYICEAERDGNKKPYIGNALDVGLERRMKAKILRLDQKKEQIKAEHRKTLELEARPLSAAEIEMAEMQLQRMGIGVPVPVIVESETVVRPIFSGPLAEAEWGKWVRQNQATVSEQDRAEF
ncbi:MAG: transposase, partial [Magnetococcales bacterium]|nr:transposase [Magnetococcales bacterium]